MKCPNCTKTLHRYDAGKFHLEICKDGCSGIWFDKGELDQCNHHAEVFPKELLRVKQFPDVAIDRAAKRNCPACVTEVMNRIVLDSESSFEIDRCSKCEGEWLDIGELEHMRNHSKKQDQLEERIAANEERIERQFNNPETAHRVSALLKLIF